MEAAGLSQGLRRSRVSATVADPSAQATGDKVGGGGRKKWIMERGKGRRRYDKGGRRAVLTNVEVTLARWWLGSGDDERRKGNAWASRGRCGFLFFLMGWLDGEEGSIESDRESPPPLSTSFA